MQKLVSATNTTDVLQLHFVVVPLLQVHFVRVVVHISWYIPML